jgi:hypothetical protein
MGTTVMIDELMGGLDTGEWGGELAGYTGYLSDAITELADQGIGIYYCEQDEFCAEHGDWCKKAVQSGIALELLEFFEHHPNAGIEDYTRHVAIAGWYEKNCDDLYRHLGDSMRHAALCAIQKAGIGCLDTRVWELISEKLDDPDANNGIDDLVDSAITEAVTDAIFTAGIDAEVDGWDTEGGRRVLEHGAAGLAGGHAASEG